MTEKRIGIYAGKGVLPIKVATRTYSRVTWQKRLPCQQTCCVQYATTSCPAPCATQIAGMRCVATACAARTRKIATRLRRTRCPSTNVQCAARGLSFPGRGVRAPLRLSHSAKNTVLLQSQQTKPLTTRSCRLPTMNCSGS